MSATQGDLRREGDAVRDGTASIQVLKSTRTTPWNCSWQVGCVDRFDYRLRLTGLPGATMPVEVLTKDTGPSAVVAAAARFAWRTVTGCSNTTACTCSLRQRPANANP